MPNSNYRKGRAFEYKVKALYEQAGSIVLRTAGSHGVFDLIVIHINNGRVTFIQCKVTEQRSVAEKMLREWKEHPPIKDKADNTFYQMLYVKCGKEILTAIV